MCKYSIKTYPEPNKTSSIEIAIYYWIFNLISAFFQVFTQIHRNNILPIILWNILYFVFLKQMLEQVFVFFLLVELLSALYDSFVHNRRTFSSWAQLTAHQSKVLWCGASMTAWLLNVRFPLKATGGACAKTVLPKKCWLSLQLCHLRSLCHLCSTSVHWLSFVSLIQHGFSIFYSCSRSVQTEQGQWEWGRIGWTLSPFLTARQAAVFHVKPLWIYAVNCTHLSCVNHLGAGCSDSPHPRADGWPTGEIKWKPAKPEAPQVLSRSQTETAMYGVWAWTCMGMECCFHLTLFKK